MARTWARAARRRRATARDEAESGAASSAGCATRSRKSRRALDGARLAVAAFDPARRGGVGAARGGADPRRRRRARDGRARAAARGARRAGAISARRSPRRSRRCFGDAADARRRRASPTVILVVGVNGTGKTTTIGKLAQQAARARPHGRRSAPPTRSAPRPRSSSRSGRERAGADFVGGARGARPRRRRLRRGRGGRARGRDVVIVDTAGRLHTQTNLMDELAKVRRVIAGRLEGAPHETLLVVDATTGQNGLAAGAALRARPSASPASR